MAVYEKCMRWVVNLSLGTSATLIALIFILINTEIFLRYVLHISTMISDEYSAYFFAIAMYLGLVAGIYNNKLIRIDIPGKWTILTAKPLPRIIVSFSGMVLTFLLLFAITHTLWFSWLFKSRSIQVSKTLMFIPQACVTLGVALMCLASLYLFIHDVHSVCKRDKL
jgi:TRAP-type C4-dicarboxylate transport system permease small subunit